MRQILAVLLLFIVSAPAVFSQAADQDCIVKYNLFKGDYSAGKYDAAYENWLWTMDNCPTLTVNIYKMGIKIAESRLEAATSEADKAAAVKLVERVYTQRLENFPKDLARVYSDFATFEHAHGVSEEEVFVLLEKSFNNESFKEIVNWEDDFYKSVSDFDCNWKFPYKTGSNIILHF